LVGEVARIWLAVAAAVFGLIVMFTPLRTRPLMRALLAAAAFTVSGVTLFHTVIVRLPGWPAGLTAALVTLLCIHVVRHAWEDRDG